MRLIPKKKYKIASIEPKHAVYRSPFEVALSAVIEFFKKNHRLKFASALLVITIVLVTSIYSSQLCYAVFLDGEEVGTAESMAQVSDVVESVEKQAAAILGYDCSLNGQISVSAEVGSVVTSSDNLGETLLNSVNGITSAYVIHEIGRAHV